MYLGTKDTLTSVEGLDTMEGVRRKLTARARLGCSEAEGVLALALLGLAMRPSLIFGSAANRWSMCELTPTSGSRR